MPRALTAAFVVMGLIGVAGAPQGVAAVRPASASVPPYVRGSDGFWELYSNHRWAASPGTTESSAKTGAPQDVRGGDVQWYVWSQCHKGLQTVTFSRTVTLPGPPAQLVFNVFSRVRSQPADEGSAVLLVNGHRIYQTEVYAFSPSNVSLDSAGQHNAFRYGNNTVEMKVTKKAGVPCTEGSNSEPFGVAWMLQGTSAADLGIAKKSTTFYRKTGSAATLYGSVPVRNFGPDEFLGAQFSVSLDYAHNLHPDLKGQEAVLLRAVSPQAPFGMCNGYTGPNTKGKAPWLLEYGATECPAASPVPPNTTANVGFEIQAAWENGIDPGYRNWGEYEVTLDVRSTGAMYDPNVGNDSITIHVVLCGKNNNNPGCANAT